MPLHYLAEKRIIQTGVQKVVSICVIYQYEFTHSPGCTRSTVFFLLNAAFVMEILDLISRVYVASFRKQLLELMYFEISLSIFVNNKMLTRYAKSCEALVQYIAKLSQTDRKLSFLGKYQ